MNLQNYMSIGNLLILIGLILDIVFVATGRWDLTTGGVIGLIGAGALLK